MKIADLKEQLDILVVAQDLNITIDPKTKRAVCPFHNDKNPSLQFSQSKQIATCFSTNCSAGTMDVIGLVEKKLNLSTHESIKHLEQHVNPMIQKPQASNLPVPDYQKDFEQMQSSALSSSILRDYLGSRNLDYKTLETGYNAFKNSRFNYLRGCATFPLKDESGKTVSLYGRSVRDNDKARHYYTADRKGLYPNYPKANTKRLILTESIIDAATLLNDAIIIKEYSILALYGTNGFTAEHTEAVNQLKELEEVVLFFDGDAAGEKAKEKYGEQLKTQYPKLKITTVATPEGEDINSLLEGHDSKIFTQLLKERKSFSSSVESLEVPEKILEVKEALSINGSHFNTSNPNNITFRTETANYQIKGGIRKDLDSLKVTLVIEDSNTKVKSRNKLDLYEDKQTEKVAREAAEKLDLRTDLVENDLNNLTDLLDEYRESKTEQEEESQQIIIPQTEKEKCFKFLKSKDLLSKINDLIGKSGVVGEEKSRIFLFGIASTYKMETTLHALIQGTSGSGKTHLLATIMDFMPPEDTISLTRVTESSFYNYGEYELSNKLLGMEDFDGLEEKAELAFRELQSKGMISSSTSGKNEHTGEIGSFIKTVYGPIASLSATTKGEIYEDNMSRCFLLSVDESAEQTQRIIQYQNNRAAGEIDKTKEVEIREFLRNCMRLIQPMEVINPYANKIELPKEAHKIRRLNELFQAYVKQITLLNQYQRTKDSQGRLITDKEDVRTTIEIMFDSIILKVDELDGSLRDFYEKLKTYILTKDKNYEFSRREVRDSTKVSNTQLHRYMKQLIDLEYIYQSSGYDNRGHKYKIGYWDNMEQLRNRIQSDLKSQIDKL